MSQSQIENGTTVQMRKGLPVGKSVEEWLLPGDKLKAEGPPDMHGGFWAVLTRKGVTVRRYWLMSGEVDVISNDSPDATD